MKSTLASATSSIHGWCAAWNTPELAARTTIEWSRRLTRSFGRCYPERRLIRVAAFLDNAESALVEEVLCHELAHLAARELHGPRIRPHGREWKALMRAVGYEPRTKLPAPPGLIAPKRRTPRYLYAHRCPVCQRSRTARRSMTRWRCTKCLAAGLEGLLTITRRKP